MYTFFSPINRSQFELTDFEVARDLLNHGIQFSTFLPVKPLPRYITPRITVLIRLAGYQFTRDNYHAYVQQRTALFSDPHIARLVLLLGGIVWRLAVATLSFDDVLEGPTTAATLQCRGIIVRTDESVDLCDDGLSTLELDIICGLHHCHTGLPFFFVFLIHFLTAVFIGEGKVYASKSWWPTDSNWQCNASHTRWTGKSDKFFNSRLEALKAGTAKPLTFSEWRGELRGLSSVRRFNKSVILAHKTFAQTHVSMW